MKSASIKRAIVTSVAGLLLIPGLLSSCKDVKGLGGGQASIKELQDGQKQILERLKKIETVLSARQGPMRPSIDYNKVYDIRIGNSPVKGPADAKATIVEFSDYQCPFSKGAQPTFKQLSDAFPKDVKHVYKNYPLPFHQKALPAAKACLAAREQGKFWEMHDLVFDGQPKLEDADFLEYAKKIGLNIKRYEEDIKGDKVQKQLDEDLKDVSSEEVTGTPTIFLNGKRVQDRSFEAMKAAIEKILSGEKEAKPAS